MADRVQNQRTALSWQQLSNPFQHASNARRSPVVPPVRMSNESVLVRPPADEEGASRSRSLACSVRLFYLL